MPGFFGFISNKKEVLDRDVNVYEIIDKNSYLIEEEAVVTTSMLYGKFFRNAVKKFERDKTFYEDQNNFHILDGVILNKSDLYREYNIDEDRIAMLLNEMSNANSKAFFQKLRGSFAGVFFNKEENIFTLYTNHVGDKEVFYHIHEKESTLYFATEFEVLIRLIHKKTGKRFRINHNAAYSLMTHSHVLCNETLFEEVYRLTPGHYIRYSTSQIEKKCYYVLSNKSIDISEAEALVKLDSYFKNAIKRSFEKDLEYGYKHLVALSGGLDSRMTAWVAHTMGYTNMLNYTFSQTDYLDEKVPKQISDKLKTEWMFKALDNGTYIYKYFDESVQISGARSQACTIAHTLSMVSNINLDKYGIIHTGQIGDVIIGTFYDNGERQSFKPGAGAYSTKLIDKVEYNIDKAFHLEDQEIFKFYNRGFTGVNIGLKPMFQYTETISPFLDIDFMDFCLSLPLDYRKGHSIYIKWINRYYPEAADFVYEKVKGKINKKVITVKGVPVPWTSIPAAGIKLIKNKLGLKLNSRNHMHPMDYWYRTNEYLSDFYEEQFYKNIDLLQDTSLKNDCEVLFRQGSTLEKDQVVTLLVFLNQMNNYIR
ncbi:hypothetical protein [Bacillus cereus group sp. BfR-BA-01380]|uniref:hypothetical protein n=1 Tax=Bacillus cereus group sp. BfR-BA-01380 TaxID=2920324 RepID=UPI001F582751|nr:hypothetical protein [Bacillus cereus group sp. BfR-BA-01380]